MELPTDHAELRALIITERDALDALLVPLDDARLTEPETIGAWSAQDLMTHIVWWEQSMLNRLEALTNGIPTGSYGDEESAFDAVNAGVAAASQAQLTAEARAWYARSRRQVLEELERYSAHDLFGEDSRLSAILGYPVIEVVAGNTYEHYAEHRADVNW